MSLAIAVAFGALWGLLGGCREQSTAPIDRNRAPETWVTAAPGDSQTSFYRVRLHWWGSDQDGMVNRFEVAVTESLPKEDEIRWRRTDRYDSTIVLPVEETREVLGHRFYVRAVDNEGKIDPTPAWIFFGAKDNVSPTVRFADSTSAMAYWTDSQSGRQVIKPLRSTNVDFPTDTIPTGSGVRFRWTGVDSSRTIAANGDTVVIGRVVKFYYRMLPIETGYLGGDSTYTSAEYPPDFFNRNPQGNVYAFNVRAIDEAGLSGSGTVVRSFVWNMDPVTRIYSDSVQLVRHAYWARDEIHTSDDTLAIGVPGDDNPPTIHFTAVGYDPDPPNGDHSVRLLEWRYNPLSSYTIWTSFRGDVTLAGLLTGDYKVQARSQDQLYRYESSPDSVMVHVNYVPRFITDGGDSITWGDGSHFRQSPMPGDIFTRAQIDSIGGIPVMLAADDRDALGAQVKFGYLFVGEKSTFDYPNMLPVNPEIPVAFVATSSIYGHAFPAGRRTIRVIVHDNANIGGEEHRGQRTKTRDIPFRIVE